MNGRPRKSENGFDYDRRMDWYRSRGWSATRDAAERLAEGKCARCGGGDRVEVHHIADPFPMRSIELLLRFDNLEVLCAACHRVEHNDEGAVTACETCETSVRHNPFQTGRRRFCSIPCRDKHPDFARREDRTCAEAACGKSFYPVTASQLRCSRKCAAAYTARVKRERKEREQE